MPNPFPDPPSPAQVRAALRNHLARKLGWSGKTADACLAPLSNEDLARCLTVDVEETRTALYTSSCDALAQAGGLQSAAA
ncbi:hypothetical protein ASF27_01615 [Methylobacterium sp. Leaf102]|uniref:hypothetical protein n=1 Tax=Methylobacterium sp. Leaf102 TaxID=1736253 RepID=UPI0007012759|nr:hypothetical protein [Methylobacterium sp. Leaf102]KQP34286.1 hypothetical protein ASF27_01615 [Methylobacterium sp. Leaf102]